MSGENESKKPKIDERHAKVEQLLKTYPDKIGIGQLRPINDTHRFLTMSIQEMRKMTAEECGEAAVTLNQAATYIQLEMNKIQADISWCTDYINWLISRTIDRCGGQYTPYEPYRRTMAIRNNDVATKLQEIINRAKLRVRSLEYLPNQLRATAASYSDLQQTKRSQRA